MSVYADDVVFTGPNGEQLRYAVLKAMAGKSVVAKQRNIVKRLTPDKQKDFYYKAYEILHKQTFEDKAEPFLKMGVSHYTFMNEPLKIGGFDTSFGQLFSRIHRALLETTSTFDFGE